MARARRTSHRSTSATALAAATGAGAAVAVAAGCIAIRTTVGVLRLHEALHADPVAARLLPARPRGVTRRGERCS